MKGWYNVKEFQEFQTPSSLLHITAPFFTATSQVDSNTATPIPMQDNQFWVRGSLDCDKSGVGDRFGVFGPESDFDKLCTYDNADKNVKL